MATSKIITEVGAIDKLAQYIADDKSLGSVCTIITDTHLAARGEMLRVSLKKAHIAAHMIVLPHGEKTKSFATVEKISSLLVKQGLRRDSFLIALGGGVIGDVSGFAASIYMRGIEWIAVPTTVLAMADASIGGKTGIDLPEGKNLIGTFHHPRYIVIDPAVLKTLPQRDFEAGMAEIIKHAVIADRALFVQLEKNARAILRRDPAILKKILAKSAQIKMRVVGKDEKESIRKKSGVSRMLLNFGHTVGHALEQLSSYAIPHGQAVAIGMAAEMRIAVGKKIMKESEAARVIALLKKFALRTKLPSEYTPAQLKKSMLGDKKNIEGKVHFALPTKIGAAKILPFAL